MANSFDEFSQAISDEVTCPICLEEFKEPKLLLCSHNICLECLELMPMPIICPVCRKPTPIPKGGVKCLPTNAALVRVVEATLARKARIEIQNSLATGKQVVEDLAKRISDFDKPLRVLNKIQENADKLVQVIRSQEAVLYREVEEFYHINCETINEDKSDLDKLHSSASKSVQEAETILRQTRPDSKKAINAARVLREQIQDITELGVNRDALKPEDLEFEINTAANIIFEYEKFGKLTKKGLSSREPFNPMYSTPGTPSDARNIRRLKGVSAVLGQLSRQQVLTRQINEETPKSRVTPTPQVTPRSQVTPKPQVTPRSQVAGKKFWINWFS